MTETQTETPTDTFSSGIGMTTLASEKGAVDNIREDSPIAINGVLIPENTVLRGGQGVEHFYSPQMAERAAEVLRQQIADGETVHLVKNFHETEGQAPADDIIGEVTAAGYSPGVGVVFEGETTDRETANKIGNGYLDVSPSVARGLGELDPTMEARSVTEVAAFRDVAVVGRGQPGVDVEVGPNPAVEALSLDALGRATDTLGATSGDDGVDTQSTDGPADGQTDDQPQPDTMSDELTDDEQALLAAVEDPSEAIDVLRDYSSREEPKIIDASNYETIEPDELDTLRENVRQAKEAFAALLAEDSPLSVDALARSDMDALTEPFRDDDGDIDIDTLRQTPETGEVDPSTDPDPDPADGPVGVDTLGRKEYDDLKLQKKKLDRFENTDMDRAASRVKSEIVDTLGAESYDDIAAELEAL